MQETYTLSTLDIGSNATRLRIYEIEPTAPPREVFRHRFPLQLGAGTFKGGLLGPEQELALVTALKEALALNAHWHARETLAVATSAVRDAANGTLFLEHIFQQTGIRVQIISGAEEARLMARGAASVHPAAAMAASGQSFAIIDVGGGSTEIVILRPPDSILGNISVKLGAVRIAHQWHCRGPMAPAAVAERILQVTDLVKNELAQMEPTTGPGALALPRLHRAACALGGTPGALRQMIGLEGGEIPEDAIADCLVQIAPLPPEELQHRFGLDSNRAQLILAGAIILQGCLHALGVQAIIPTDRGVCEGLALNYSA